MTVLNLRLRTKSMILLAAACLLALVPTVLIGLEALERARAHFGKAYARNFTLQNAQKIEAPVAKELALARRFADSVLLAKWLADEESESKKELFFREAKGFQKDFRDHNYFVISRETLGYYINNLQKPYSEKPRYYLDPENPDDAWFFKTMEDFDSFNINVNPDVHLNETRVWINVIVRHGGKRVGLAGTGLGLGSFLDNFITLDEPGVTPMILNAEGAIQAHPDRSLISFGSGAKAGSEKFFLKDQIENPSDVKELKETIKDVRESPGSVKTFWAGLNGKKQLLAVSWIPELEWYVASAVDLHAAKVISQAWVTVSIAGLALIFGVLVLAFGYGVDRLVLSPLNKLQQSATALADGDYDVSMPPEGRDEIGELSRAFAAMVKQIKSHTRNLEEKVKERTKELENRSVQLQEAKEEADTANKAKTENLNQVMESIHYARTIQQAILTTEEQLSQLVPHSFVIWQPKDIISGDMIWSREHRDGFAAAVIDCTGHGVPGGIMTMAAATSLNRVVSETGLENPRHVLQEVSRVVRKMLSSQQTSGFSEDGLDMGLCVYFRSSRTLIFAGSRLSLFYGQGKEVKEIKGGKQSLGYCSSDPDYPFENHEISLQGQTDFYLATDGIIDQVGQETGLPLGKRRFLEFLNAIREKAMPDQKQALYQMFEDFRGTEEQRDDVTAVGFRLFP